LSDDATVNTSPGRNWPDDAAGTQAVDPCRAGKNLQIEKLEGILQFSTCRAVGCLVPVSKRKSRRCTRSHDLKIDAVAVDTADQIFIR
jgi:hypothetical protein